MYAFYLHVISDWSITKEFWVFFSLYNLSFVLCVDYSRCNYVFLHLCSKCLYCYSGFNYVFRAQYVKEKNTKLWTPSEIIYQMEENYPTVS